MYPGPHDMLNPISKDIKYRFGILARIGKLFKQYMIKRVLSSPTT